MLHHLALQKGAARYMADVKHTIRFIQRFFGSFLVILGGSLFVIVFFCAFAALLGLLETSGFGEQITFFLIYAALAFASACVVSCGVRLRKRGEGQPLPKRKDVRQIVHAADRPSPLVKTAQATPEQQRIREIEQQIDLLTGDIQANPMNHRLDMINTERIQALTREKDELLLTRTSAEPTVQDAWRSFSPEDQAYFEAQLYQYSQDTGRDGRTPEEAASNRGLVFIGHRPVPAEVARRLEEMREAARKKEKETAQLRQNIKTCRDFLIHTKTMFMLPSGNDEGWHGVVIDKESGQPYEVWCRIVGHSGSTIASVPVEVLDRPVCTVSYARMIAMAEEQYPGVARQYAGMNETNWQNYANVYLNWISGGNNRESM